MDVFDKAAFDWLHSLMSENECARIAPLLAAHFREALAEYQVAADRLRYCVVVGSSGRYAQGHVAAYDAAKALLNGK